MEKFLRIWAAAAYIVLATTAALAAPGRLVHVARVPMEKAREVAFLGDHAYVGQNFLGITVLDVAKPKAPRVVQKFTPEQSQPLALKAFGRDKLVIADRFRGLVIWDLADPDRPTTLSELLLPGISTDVDVIRVGQRDIAAVACGGTGVVTVDITDPTSPTALANFTTQIDYSRRLLLHRHMVFLSDNFNGGLKVLNVSDPGQVQPWYQVRIRGFCEHATLRGDLLAVSYRNYGVKLFRLNEAGSSNLSSTPSLTLLSSTTRSSSRVRTTALLSNSRMFVANDEQGVELYDVANPSLPYLCDEFSFSQPEESAQSCAEHQGYVYVPCWDGGLQIFRIEDATRPGS